MPMRKCYSLIVVNSIVWIRCWVSIAVVGPWRPTYDSNWPDCIAFTNKSTSTCLQWSFKKVMNSDTSCETAPSSEWRRKKRYGISFVAIAHCASCVCTCWRLWCSQLCFYLLTLYHMSQVIELDNTVPERCVCLLYWDAELLPATDYGNRPSNEFLERCCRLHQAHKKPLFCPVFWSGA